MNFSIISMTRFESSSSEGSSQKRSVTVLPRVPRRGLLNGLDSEGLSSIPSRHTHSHLSNHKRHARHGRVLDATTQNESSGADIDFLLGKRQSGVGQGNANLPTQQQIPGPPNLITCAGNTNRLPKFRYVKADVLFREMLANVSSGTTAVSFRIHRRTALTAKAR